MKPIRVLVVDDTIVYRKIVGDVLKDIPGIEVIGTANNGMAENMQKIKAAVLPIIDALKRREKTRLKLRERISPSVSPRPITNKVPSQAPQKPAIRSRSTLIGIGISTGGPNALTKMIPMLPGNLNAAILIVQHMPPLFTDSLAKSLNNKSPLDIKEARNGDKIEVGKVFIAPGGKQMKIITAVDGTTKRIKITDDPPENSCKPSADYLFRSIAEHYPGKATGVIMTGMGSDGSKGLVQMKTRGSFVIAQDEDTCTVYGMPKVPVESGIADRVLPLDKIADQIVRTTT